MTRSEHKTKRNKIRVIKIISFLEERIKKTEKIFQYNFPMVFFITFKSVKETPQRVQSSAFEEYFPVAPFFFRYSNVEFLMMLMKL